MLAPCWERNRESAREREGEREKEREREREREREGGKDWIALSVPKRN